MVPPTATAAANEKPTLEALAYACHWYDQITSGDSSYRRLVAETGGHVDLANSAHRSAVLAWLNRSGCRQFKKADHPLASSELQAWWTKCEHLLPEVGKPLVDCTALEVGNIGEAYAVLKEKQACTRVVGGTRQLVTFGHTGASKALFTTRPQAAMPWDNPERKALRFDESGGGYTSYLRHAQGILRALSPACRRYGIQLDDLPMLLGRREATPAKLVDEYYWATVTRKVAIPDETTLHTWFANLLQKHRQARS
jgi:hypothetical protein